MRARTSTRRRCSATAASRMSTNGRHGTRIVCTAAADADADDQAAAEAEAGATEAEAEAGAGVAKSAAYCAADKTPSGCVSVAKVDEENVEGSA